MINAADHFTANAILYSCSTVCLLWLLMLPIKKLRWRCCGAAYHIAGLRDEQLSADATEQSSQQQTAASSPSMTHWLKCQIVNNLTLSQRPACLPLSVR